MNANFPFYNAESKKTGAVCCDKATALSLIEKQAKKAKGRTPLPFFFKLDESLLNTWSSLKTTAQ